MLGEIIVKQASCAHILVFNASVVPSFRVLTDLIFHLTLFKLVCVCFIVCGKIYYSRAELCQICYSYIALTINLLTNSVTAV